MSVWLGCQSSESQIMQSPVGALSLFPKWRIERAEGTPEKLPLSGDTQRRSMPQGKVTVLLSGSKKPRRGWSQLGTNDHKFGAISLG